MSEQRESSIRPPSSPSAHTVDQAPAPADTDQARPTIADGRDKQLDPKSITVQRLGGAIATAALSLIALIGAVSVMIAASNTMLQGALWLGGWLLFTLLVAGLSFFWPPVRYRHVFYRVDDKGFQIKRGVFWKSTVNVPHSRVQHTDVQQGPIERGYGLATLIIHTAGTQHASIPLSGLAHETALRIRDFLLEDEDQRSHD